MSACRRKAPLPLAKLLVERYVALETLVPFVADEFVVESDDVHDVAQILGWNLAFVVHQ